MTCLALVWMLLPGGVRALDFGRPLISVYSPEIVGTDAMAWSIAQDDRGILHFGCNALISFDGDHWRTSPIGQSYALRGLEASPDGRLWAAAVNEMGWFEREGTMSWHFHSLLGHLPVGARAVGELWCAFSRPGGAVFVSQDRVYWWDGRNFTVSSLPGTRRLSAVRAGEAIYVHHLLTGLYRVDRGSLELKIAASVLGDAAVIWLEEAPEGWLLATSKGLCTYARGELRPVAPEASAFIRANVLTSVTRLPSGQLALGTLRGGIAVAGAEDGRIAERYGIGRGLPTNEIFSLRCDREGGLWAAAASYIARLDLTSPTRCFGEEDGLPDRSYVSLAGFGEKLAAATDDEIDLFDAAGRSTVKIGKVPGHIWNLTPWGRGFLAARNGGVDWYDGREFRRIFATSQDAFCVAPSRVNTGRLLISTGREIELVDPESGSRESLIAGLKDMAGSVAEGADGRLWLGTRAGIFTSLTSRPEGAAIRAGLDWGLPDTLRTALVTGTATGVVLVFSADGGWSLRPGARRFRRIADYPARAIAAYGIAPASELVWVVHPPERGAAACLARLQAEGEGYRWIPHALDGLWKIGVPMSLQASPSGRKWKLWVGGTKGLILSEIDPGERARRPPAPLLNLAVREAGGGGGFRLIRSAVPYAKTEMMIDFAIPSFSRRPALRGETWIDGIDSQWVPIGPAGDRGLPGLRDGRYRIVARSVAETGEASAATSANLIIRPPWWRTATAKIGWTLLLVALLIGIYRGRTRALRRRAGELEALVRRRTEQADQANLAKTEFVATLSHDIRNPLNGVVGLTLALQDTPLDARQREIVAVIRSCAGYLATLTEKVLDLSQIEAGRIDLRASRFAPRGLLDEIGLIMKSDPLAATSTFAVRVAPGVPPAILADYGKVQEILMNYAQNAAKYAGGEIELAVRPGSAENGTIEFSVRDHGPGIGEAEQGLLFTRFGRLSERKDGLIEGFGMGLFSCRRLAEAMGGKVGVESEVGQGARFFLVLPLVTGAVNGGQSAEELGPMRVLVVDDVPYNIPAAEAVLARLGLTLAAHAVDGATALARLREATFDLVLLDRNLPDGDGLEVARHLSRERMHPAPMVIGVSAYSTAEDRAAALAAGLDAFVAKPLTPEKLRAAILDARQGGISESSAEPTGSGTGGLSTDIFGFLGNGDVVRFRQEKDRYLLNLQSEVGQLRAAVASGDGPTAGRWAHRLLASARLVNAVALAEAAERLERTCRQGDAAALAQAAAPVLRLVEEISAAWGGGSSGLPPS